MLDPVLLEQQHRTLKKKNLKDLIRNPVVKCVDTIDIPSGRLNQQINNSDNVESYSEKLQLTYCFAKNQETSKHIN